MLTTSKRFNDRVLELNGTLWQSCFGPQPQQKFHKNVDQLHLPGFQRGVAHIPGPLFNHVEANAL
jgi:hypothetical protein